jgi:hypothetical protein
MMSRMKRQFSRRDVIKLAGTAAIGLPAAKLVAATREVRTANQSNTSPNVLSRNHQAKRSRMNGDEQNQATA